MEDEEQHALISQEDKPLTPQPLKGGHYVRHGKGNQNNTEQSFVANIPQGGGAWKLIIKLYELGLTLLIKHGCIDNV